MPRKQRVESLSLGFAASWRSEAPISVVHLVTNVNVGGLERVVLQLARRTDRRMFRSHVICLEERGALAPLFEQDGIPVETLKSGRLGFVSRVGALVFRLRALRADVLHTHNPGPHLHGAVAARLAGVRALIHTKHGRNYPNQRLRVGLNRVASWLSDWIVPVSADAADVARRVEGVPASKLRLIRNGVDLPPVTHNRSCPPTHAIVVARLHPVKDHETLLKAVRLIANAEPRFRLEVVGDGPCRSSLETLSARLGLAEHVRFLGEREDIQQLLSNAGVFVLASITEGLSLTVLEAMAAGLPVVASDVGGNSEIVHHGTSGVLVPARDPQAIANAVMGMIRDPEKARRMGCEGRRIVETRFDVSQVVRAYERLYLEALKSAPTSERAIRDVSFPDVNDDALAR